MAYFLLQVAEKIIIAKDLLLQNGSVIILEEELSMGKFERISKKIDSFRDEMIDMQIRLCGTPAISPSSGGKGELEKAKFLLRFLEENGLKNIQLIKAPDLDAPPGYRPNILACYKGKSSSKTVWVMTHMDVVPPGELSQWKGDPFKAWIKEGKIFGRGVEDNQQDMVASLFALKAFLSEGITPSYDIGIALVADEEMGNEKGIIYVLNHSDAFKKQDLIIVPDAGNEEGTMIEVAEKSILWLKFKTFGVQTHASTPEKGINSFRAASFFVTELNNLYQFFPQKDSLFEPSISTFEPTKKEANVPNINTIPGEDVFYMDCRILPGYKVKDVEKKIQELIKNTEKKFKVKIVKEEVQKVLSAPPTSVNSPVVKALKKAIKSVYKKEAKPMGIGGGTVADAFRKAGFDAACWARVDETAHQPNEYCIIENMMGDAKVFAHIFLQE